MAIAYTALTLFLVCLYGLRLDLTPVLSADCFAAYGWLLLVHAALFLLLEAARLDRAARRRGGEGLSLLAATHTIRRRYDLRSLPLDLARFVLVIHLVTILDTNLKQQIPAVNPALFDAHFAGLDRLLFFGLDPVRALAASALMATPGVARFVDETYILWYAVKLPIIAWFGLTARRYLARQFVAAFAMMWLLHALLVLSWPSLGPVYVQPEWFAPLALEKAQNLQTHLWANYQLFLHDPEHYRMFMYEGVAAFPSMHVGLLALYALFVGKVNRPLGRLLWAYTLLIQIGSCATGWHYFVDGPAGILMACVAVRWSERSEPPPGWRRPAEWPECR